MHQATLVVYSLGYDTGCDRNLDLGCDLQALNLFRRKTGTNRFFAVKLVKKVRLSQTDTHIGKYMKYMHTCRDWNARSISFTSSYKERAPIRAHTRTGFSHRVPNPYTYGVPRVPAVVLMTSQYPPVLIPCYTLVPGT
jgi:hypothetical protein